MENKHYPVIDTLIEIVSLYYDGLSEKTLNKRFLKDYVHAVLHKPEFKKLRDYYAGLKRETFENHWKTHGLSGMIGDKL